MADASRPSPPIRPSKVTLSPLACDGETDALEARMHRRTRVDAVEFFCRLPPHRLGHGGVGGDLLQVVDLVERGV